MLFVAALFDELPVRLRCRWSCSSCSSASWSARRSFSLILTGDQGVAVRSGLLATFACIALACAAIAVRLQPRT